MSTPDDLPDIYTPCGNCLPCGAGCIEDCIEFGKIKFTAFMDVRCMALAIDARFKGDHRLANEFDRLGVGVDIFQGGTWVRVARDEYK